MMLRMLCVVEVFRMYIFTFVYVFSLCGCVCSVVCVCGCVCVRVCRPHARDTCASETKCVFLCVNVRRFECVRRMCESARSGRGRASMHGPRLAPHPIVHKRGVRVEAQPVLGLANPSQCCGCTCVSE